MRKPLALLLSIAAFGAMAGPANACHWRHGHDDPPAPAHFYWYMTGRDYAQWREFGLFKGSYRERYRVVRRYPGNRLVVKVSRPALPATRCRYL
jgi:hypothetical protein